MSRDDTEKIEIIISKVLIAGVLLSAAIILIGLMMYLITGSSGYQGNTYPTNPQIIFQGVLLLKPYAIILFGLFILILTPILRVGISIIVFIKERDFLYVNITSIVFIILIISFLLGKVE